MAPSELKLPEIAKRIAAHLARMEADQDLNTLPEDPEVPQVLKYVNATSYRAGSKLAIVYNTIYPPSPPWKPWMLTKAEALTYLAKLDAGKNGYHYLYT